MLDYLNMLQGQREVLLTECCHAFEEFKIKGNLWYSKTYEQRRQDFMELEAEIKIVEKLIEQNA